MYVFMRRSYIVLGILGLLLLFVIGSYNGHVSRDQAVKASWSEVVNKYQRRADLIPNLVRVVKSYATHEKDTLTAVIQARASATSFQITPEVLNNPQALLKFQEIQGGLSQALSRLMVVTEKYPELKANENFRDLQSQLEGTENRITVSRKRFITSVQEYNTGIHSFPGNITAKLFGFDEKQNFQVANEAEISKAPEVDFSK